MILALPAAPTIFAPTLSLGPASLSLPELGQALTKAGMPTEVSPALRDRGAFVCLRSRSPEEIRRLLGEALDVAFRPNGTAWTMIVDPVAKDRDRLLLIAYKRQAAERVREWAAARDRVRAGRAYAVLDRETAASLDRLRKTPAGADANATAKQDLPDLLIAGTLLQPGAWCVVRDARNAAIVYGAIERPQEHPWVVSSSYRAYGLPDEVLRAAMSAGANAASSVETEWSFDPETGFLTARPGIALNDGNRAPFEPHKVEVRAAGLGFTFSGTEAVTVPAEGNTLEETFRRMGHALPGRTPDASLPDEPQAPLGSPTLSVVLEGLGLAGVEAVVELSPRFEVAPASGGGVPAERTSLRRALRLAPPPSPFRLSPDVEWARPLLDSLNPRPTPEREFPWRAANHDGVWLLTNPLAFLDRAQPISPVPYLIAERVLAGVPEDAPSLPWMPGRLPKWSLLQTLARALPPGARLSQYRYRNLGALASFVDLLPIARLVERIPTSERDSFWRAARRPEGAVWSLDGGTLRLALIPQRGDPTAVSFAQVSARWNGPNGAETKGSGTIDPRGLGDEPTVVDPPRGCYAPWIHGARAPSMRVQKAST